MRCLLTSLPVAVWVARLSAASAQQGIYCDPCSNGETPSNDEECLELVEDTEKMIARTPQCAALQLELYQTGCCTKPPRDKCTLCPDGRSFDGSSVVPNFEPADGDVSCADLNADESFLDYLFESGTCDDTLLRRSAAWCGCPGVERQCSLCPNGERPPNPGLIDPVYYGWDCDTFDFVSSYFSKGECRGLVDSIFEFDAPSYCGCTDSPIPDVCDLCPPGHIIANPDMYLGHNNRFTCRELALSTRYIPADEPCERVLSTHESNGYIGACCAPIDQVPKKYGGTSGGREIKGGTQWLSLTLLVSSSLLLLWD
jgi:hypothetical protein